ncbi:hypothetical protein [Limnohabitans sp. 2KL-3]|uniref:TA system antitoxin ParD family protein n=1 Tax=Limnohabitans sp. 2KL-3 TaxID=1100700 RepID=UPI001E620E20|nr:hypothetical protein [Limnohabitans sp. 2KL-3]
MKNSKIKRVSFTLNFPSSAPRHFFPSKVIAMGKPVDIHDGLYSQAKAYAVAERQTIAEQINLWAMVGKAGLDNPDLPTAFVRDLIVARRQNPELAKPFVPASTDQP